MLRKFLPDTFVALLLVTLAIATFLPAQGMAANAVSLIADAAIVLLFFFHGAKLSRESILAGLRHWRLHVVILSSTFILFPLLGVGLSASLPDLLPTPLWIGIVYLSVLPSTVQSSIAFTSMARGNIPAAVAAASASQLAGVLLTPLMVGVLVGRSGGSSSIADVGPILLQILVPFVVGHVARPLIADWVKRHGKIISMSDRLAILLAVYSAFSAAVIEGLWHRVPLPVLAILCAILLALLGVVLLTTWLSARAFGFNREDEITIVFCGTKKSLIQGVPMARVLFAGPDLGMILLPVMLFHQFQLMACAWIARRYAKDPIDDR